MRRDGRGEGRRKGSGDRVLLALQPRCPRRLRAARKGRQRRGCGGVGKEKARKLELREGRGYICRLSRRAGRVAAAVAGERKTIRVEGRVEVGRRGLAKLQMRAEPFRLGRMRKMRKRLGPVADLRPRMREEGTADVETMWSDDADPRSKAVMDEMRRVGVEIAGRKRVGRCCCLAGCRCRGNEEEEA
jgi:hypothetical protein